jgi:hypothetical protein
MPGQERDGNRHRILHGKYGNHRNNNNDENDGNQNSSLGRLKREITVHDAGTTVAESLPGVNSGESISSCRINAADPRAEGQAAGG